MSGFIISAYMIFSAVLLGLGVYLLRDRRRTLARLQTLNAYTQEL